MGERLDSLKLLSCVTSNQSFPGYMLILQLGVQELFVMKMCLL